MSSIQERLANLKATGQRNVVNWVDSKEDLKEGDECAGVVVEKGEIETNFGISPIVTLDVDPDNPKADFVRVMGFHGIIEDAIQRSSVGDLFYVRFLGRVPSKKEGHDPYYNYRCIVEDAVTGKVEESDSF